MSNENENEEELTEENEEGTPDVEATIPTQIGRKLYFELSTGYVLVDIGERFGYGGVVETTMEEDFASYVELAERLPETVGMLQFEYGELAEDFNICNGYRVNVETMTMEFSYPDEPGTPTDPVEPVFRKPLTLEVDELKADNATIKADNHVMMEAIAEVYEMLLGGV